MNPVAESWAVSSSVMLSPEDCTSFLAELCEGPSVSSSPVFGIVTLFYLAILTHACVSDFKLIVWIFSTFYFSHVGTYLLRYFKEKKTT